MDLLGPFGLTLALCGGALIGLPFLDHKDNRARTALFAICIVLTWRYILWRFTPARPRPLPPWYVNRQAESVDAAVAVLSRARDLISDERRWCKRAFAFTWLDIRDHYVAICTAILCARRHQTGRLRPWVACRQRQQGARMANRAADNRLE